MTMLDSGTTLGGYRIVGHLGTGGMGEVYRAHDPKLGRDIALKVLRDLPTADADRRSRFEREAKTIAALDHPGIVTIHSIEEDRGITFITMQLVQGRTLADAIPQKGLSPQKFFDVAVPLADAVAAAHQRDIVHRDLKPSNVMLTDEGRVKVLDFGLAKLKDPVVDGGALTVAPAQQLTAAGQIVGTVAYMSPEQAEGRTVDHRSDVFSLGIIFYEMAVGARPFHGDTPLSTLTSILRDTPKPITTMNPLLPRHLGRIVRRCLEKDPARRYQTTIDLRNDLEDLKREIESGVATDDAAVRPARIASTFRATMVAAGLTLLIGALTGVWIGRRSQPAVAALRPESALLQLTANPAELPVYGAAISPDGKYLAYTDANGLFLRIVDTGETHQVPVPEELRFWDVSWFPDGTRILVTGPSPLGDTMSLYSVPAFGGTPRKLQDDAWRAAVSPDGTAVAFLRARYPVREVWLMGSGGEQPKRIIEGGAGETLWQVGWSPDSDRIIVGSAGGKIGEESDNAIVSVDRAGATRHVIVSDPRLFQNWRSILPYCWLPGGRFIFTRIEPPPNADSSNLWELKIDERTATARSAPERLTQISGYNIRDIRATLSGGRLTFLRERNQQDVYIATLQSAPVRLGTPIRLTLDDRDDRSAAWTLDGRTIVFESRRAGSWDIFKQPVDRPTAEPLVIAAGSDQYPRMSTDGAWVLYRRDRRVMRVPIAGGPSELVLEGVGPVQMDCGSPSAGRCVVSEQLGKEFVFSELDPLRGRGRELRRFETASPDFSNWALSPDARQIALVDFRNRVLLFDLAGGPPRDLSLPGWTAFEFVTWAADGRGVFATGFSVQGPRLTNTAILHLDLQGHAQVLRHELNEWHVMPVASPDGKRLAFATMKLESNAWMIEKF